MTLHKYRPTSRPSEREADLTLSHTHTARATDMGVGASLKRVFGLQLVGGGGGANVVLPK